MKPEFDFIIQTYIGDYFIVTTVVDPAQDDEFSKTPYFETVFFVRSNEDKTEYVRNPKLGLKTTNRQRACQYHLEKVKEELMKGSPTT